MLRLMYQHEQNRYPAMQLNVILAPSMSPRSLTYTLIACLALTACNKAQDSANNVLDTVGNETSDTYNKVRDIFDLHSKPKPEKPTQPSYCYKTMQDIICYPRPLPGQEERLTGY